VRFDDFVLQFDASSRGGFRARVLKSPFGEGGVAFSLSALAGTEPAMAAGGISRGLEGEGELTRDLQTAEAVAAAARPPLEIGTELYRSVFQGAVKTLLDKSRGQLERSSQLGLRLKIKLDPNDLETGELADLPWELLCDGETEDFFALSRQTSIVRYLDVPRSSQPIPFTPPLRILAVGASPYNLQPLDLDAEMRGLDTLNSGASGVEVKFLAHASAGAVRQELAKDTYNVLHFMGHGLFDRASGEGMLAFEGADGAPDLVSGKAFATKLKDLRSLGVVMLNACNTARAGQAGGGNPFRGVATALVLGGVPAVAAMQKPISDRAAIAFSTAFYRHLASGDSVDEALTEGRQAIHSAKPDSFEWATPVLFLRLPEGNVFEARPAPAPAPEEPERRQPPVLPPPEPAPALSRRGLAIKVATGGLGAALVSVVLYTKLLSPANVPGPTNSTDGTTASPSIQAPSGEGQSKVAEAPKPAVKTKPVSDAGVAHHEENHHVVIPPGPTTPMTSSSPPEQPPVQPPKAQEAVTADLTFLVGQVMSIAQRSEGGISVTVQFTNSSTDSRLSVVIDVENSVLNDDKGESNGVLSSSLPKRDSNLQLDLAPGASRTASFNFPMPQRGAKTFGLNLLTNRGGAISIKGSPMTLAGSP
jgi:CHAT domain